VSRVVELGLAVLLLVLLGCKRASSSEESLDSESLRDFFDLLDLKARFSKTNASFMISFSTAVGDESHFQMVGSVHVEQHQIVTLRLVFYGQKSAGLAGRPVVPNDKNNTCNYRYYLSPIPPDNFETIT